MASQYAKKKIPWLKIALVLLIIGIVIYALAAAVPALGGAIIGVFVGIGNGLYMFFIGAPSYISVIAAVGITAGVFILVTQRKYFFKQKIYDGSAAQSMGVGPLQTGLMQTNPFANQPSTGTVVADPTKTEVSTST
jgi:hypothetical protein